jgi:hypothetical protein
VGGVEWVHLTNDAVKAGDLVSAEAGGMPIYRVVAVEGGQAWLQRERATDVQMMPLHRFHWRVARATSAPP